MPKISEVSKGRQMSKMPKVSKVTKMAVDLWAERALPYWLRNERSFTIFFDLAGAVPIILGIFAHFRHLPRRIPHAFK